MTVPTKVLIADDHSIIRTGLRALLSSQADLAVVGEASNGLEAVALWRETRPDVGLFDMLMPSVDGVEALRRIREHQPQAAVIMLATLAREGDVERAIRVGARGYLLKDAAMTEIVACIQSVQNGEARELGRMKSRLPNMNALEPLTLREAEVLEGLSRGRSNRPIAEALGIGESTVKTHLKRIYAKLNARNRTEAIVVARSKGLL